MTQWINWLKERPVLRIVLSLAILLSSASPTLVTCAAGTDTKTALDRYVEVKVIAFNDYHGQLKSPGVFGRNTAVPPGQRPPAGGAEYIAAHIARLKRQNPGHVVVAAGDLISASPLISALFHDEPAVETLNRVGLEFSAVGNHEFDRGSTELLRLQNGGCRITGGAQDPNSCRGSLVGTPVPFEGAKFQWLAANVISRETGQPLLPAYGVKTFDGVSVAFIGMTLEGTPEIVTPTGVAGLEFRDEAETVNRLVPRLRQRGIEAIVVLVHQGGVQSSGLSDINGCDGDLVGSEIAQIVSRLDDAVDLVVTGHTHSAYNCSADTTDAKVVNGALRLTPRPTGLPNSSGRLVPVVSSSAYGRVLSDIDLQLDRSSKDVTKVRVNNLLVDRSDARIQAAVATDPDIADIADIVSAYEALVAPLANRVIGSIAAELPNKSDVAGNMPAGELIADAQLAATQASERGRALVAFVNPGGVRSAGFIFDSSPAGEGDGNVTYGEAFSVQPFGNSLVTVTMTAAQLKDALEQQFAGCLGQSATRILIPSRGLKYTWRANEDCGNRVRDLILLDAEGVVVDRIVDAQGSLVAPDATYRVTVNSFLAAGGDGFSVFTKAGEPVGGPLDIDALVDYLARYRPLSAPYDPMSPERLKPRIARAE